MRNFSEHLATADDIRNCFALVQDDSPEYADFTAEKLLAAIAELEAQNYAPCPILERSGKTVTLVYCPEIKADDEVIIGEATISVKSVEHTMDEEEQPERTVVTFSSNAPEGSILYRPVEPTIYEKLGISKAEIDEIKEVLSNE